MNTRYLGFVLCILIFLPAAQGAPEDKVAQLGLVLPATSAPVANYVSAVRSGSLLFLSGHLPRDGAGKIIVGKIGRELDEAAGTNASRQTALALIATLKTELGSLDRVKRIVRVGGFVNCTDDFTRQPAVINGCSDLLVAVFGESGRHARAAIGVSSLPAGAAVEIDLVVEVSD
jgi:enamine deaminase RidA (YjgF/YER057c/UK114 family)